ILELNNTVRRLLKAEFPQYIWVCGETQDLRASKDKRHIYFDLVQKHPHADEIVAKVSAAIFDGRKSLIFKRIDESEGMFQLKNDIEVKFLCEVSLYPKSGQYNLIIVDIDPVYTLGKFAQTRQKIIEELERKGVFDQNKSTYLPALPLSIGLITAYDSAAYHDFINELKLSGYSFKILSYDCYMQGKNTSEDVVKALSFFNSLPNSQLDAVVITRGGGATADLSWFDNRAIALAIAVSSCPVITALGHQINTTITDLVSYISLKTPTKAAQYFVERVRAEWDSLDSISKEIIRQVSVIRQTLSNDLERRSLRVGSVINKFLGGHKEDLARKKSLILENAKHLVTRESKVNFDKIGMIKACLKRALQISADNVKYNMDKIKLLDPRTILKRGYTITLKGEKMIKTFRQLKKGDAIKTIFFKGEVESSVNKVYEDNDG
ncbi:MAG: exodeoxyribonuclease VII large subunit, partial [Candidatus Omnitrophota bacterium]